MSWEPSDELVEKCRRDIAEIHFFSDEIRDLLKAAVASGELVPREWLEEVGVKHPASSELHPINQCEARVKYGHFSHRDCEALYRIHPQETD